MMMLFLIRSSLLGTTVPIDDALYDDALALAEPGMERLYRAAPLH